MLKEILSIIIKAPEAIYEFNITNELTILSGHPVWMGLATSFIIALYKVYVSEYKPFEFGLFPNL